jgi:GTP-binding protein
MLEAGVRLAGRPWTFLKSVPALEFLPPADRVELAFAGRSNVGKSSLINATLAHGKLARTSNTPGRTQELNFYRPETPAIYLVDMPGYGFAKAPKDKVDAWTALVKDYLRGRTALARVVLLIDSRHGLKSIDRGIMELLDTSAVSYQVVLTKGDKLDPRALEKVRAATEQAVRTHPAAYPSVLATSSETGVGIAELRAEMARLLAERGVAV